MTRAGRYRRAAATLALAVLASCVATGAASEAADPAPPHRLPPVRAAGIGMDTLFLGGYASGSFAQALQTLASDLTPGERTMIGLHLDRIFREVLRGEDMARGGRLRVAYERAARPDGTTRSIRVLAAEAAVGGQMHTAFFFEHDGQPGFYDNTGRSLDVRGWIHPLPHSRVTSPFNSQRMHPLLNRVLPHLGVDYAAPSGTPVRVTGDGSVSVAERRGGYGLLVEVQHPNGYVTRYAHLSRIPEGIRRGVAVQQGDVIGHVGMTGLATGPHLHYEVRRHGRPVDPERVRLETGLAAEIGFDPEWDEERQRLTRLLARAPRALPRTGAMAGP